MWLMIQSWWSTHSQSFTTKHILQKPLNRTKSRYSYCLTWIEQAVCHFYAWQWCHRGRIPELHLCPYCPVEMMKRTLLWVELFPAQTMQQHQCFSTVYEFVLIGLSLECWGRQAGPSYIYLGLKAFLSITFHLFHLLHVEHLCLWSC